MGKINSTNNLCLKKLMNYIQNIRMIWLKEFSKNLFLDFNKDIVAILGNINKYHYY